MTHCVSRDGTKITYSKWGTGPVLILVLGALNKRGSGKKLADTLKDHFTVISYDRRGRGDSEDTLPYSVEKEVDDLEAIINDVGGSAYLYGHSSGSILVLLAAEKLGEKVKGIAVYELPHNDNPDALKNTEQYKSELLKALKNYKNEDAVSLFIKSVGVSDKQLAALKKLPMWKGLTAMAHTLQYDTIELMEFYSRIKTSKIKVPSLVMYGEASPTFMADTANTLSKELSNAKLQPLKGQTHDVKPAVLAPVLISFFG